MAAETPLLYLWSFAAHIHRESKGKPEVRRNLDYILEKLRSRSAPVHALRNKR